MSRVRHLGGCHCGRVRFEVLAPAIDGKNWEKHYPDGRGEY